MVERGVSPAERLKQLMVYSQPMSDGRRALVLRLNQTVRKSEIKNFYGSVCVYLILFQDDDKEEMKEILEMKRRHERHVNKRKDKLKAAAAATITVASHQQKNVI